MRTFLNTCLRLFLNEHLKFRIHNNAKFLHHELKGRWNIDGLRHIFPEKCIFPYMIVWKHIVVLVITKACTLYFSTKMNDTNLIRRFDSIITRLFRLTIFSYLHFIAMLYI